jgi:hypothetical protein
LPGCLIGALEQGWELRFLPIFLKHCLYTPNQYATVRMGAVAASTRLTTAYLVQTPWSQ